MGDSGRVMIVGAGLAGLRTAEELRTREYAGRITMIGAETRPPYDRPPLSKKVLIEADPPDPSLRADFAALDVDFRPGHEVTSLDELGDWDHLVLATGALPVTLPGPGPQRVLRTYDDALALREVLKPRVRLAIIGAGWIGAELSTAAVGRGCEVTVVEAGVTPVAGAVSPEIGAQMARWYEEAGVDLRLETPVESVEAGGLALGGGDWIAADEIVTAVGVRPAVGWLAGTDGLVLDATPKVGGVTVDGGLRTSLPGVFAVGDCAAFWSRRFGRRLRFEHWDVALHAPDVVAANVLGGDEVYDPVPYFWSEQFGRMVQYVGYHGDAAELVWRGDPSSGGSARWAACWLSADVPPRLLAILTVGRPRDLIQGRQLITSGTGVDVQRLSDPEVAVKDAVPGV
jgi:3-phenylpropionate/trans-cinnamate dioxygenase ferredoxin reductase subunit